jgi:hypothetical protein
MSKKESRIRRDGQAIVVQKSVTAQDLQEEPMLTTPKVAVTIIPPDNQRETSVMAQKERVDLPGGGNARQKYIYLITTKGPAGKKAFDNYISSGVDKSVGCIDFIGIKLADQKIVDDILEMSLYDEILDCVNQYQDDVKLVSMCFPYSEVHCIQNITYNKKK